MILELFVYGENSWNLSNLVCIFVVGTVLADVCLLLALRAQNFRPGYDVEVMAVHQWDHKSWVAKGISSQISLSYSQGIAGVGCSDMVWQSSWRWSWTKKMETSKKQLDFNEEDIGRCRNIPQYSIIYRNTVIYQDIPSPSHHVFSTYCYLYRWLGPGCICIWCHLVVFQGSWQD